MATSDLSTSVQTSLSQATIEAAHQRIHAYIHQTPVLHSQSVDAIAGAELYFKCENLQKVGAFKARGGLNAVLQLSEVDRAKGVATHSSGNHAQAVAFAAQQLGIPAYIVMPENSPQVKKNAVKGYGAEITECVATLQAREDTLEAVVARTGAYFIHPYDNYDVIAGQATAAKELITQERNLDYILAPVGGGGLLAGTALAARYWSPQTEVIAAEPQNADDAYQSFHAQRRIPAQNPQTIADGLRTSLGKKNLLSP